MTPRSPRTAFAAAALACLLGFAPPSASADHDGDPLGDGIEALVCGFPQVASAIGSLPPSAGRCVDSAPPTGGDDYVSPVFEPAPCAECSSAVVSDRRDEPLSQARDTAAVPLPPVEVPGVGTPPTPAVPLGTIEGARQGADEYCVTFTPEGGSPIRQCADVSAIAASVMPPIPPTPFVQSVNPPDTSPISQGALAVVPGQHVPALSYDLTAEVRWVESRLNARLHDAVTYWEPVDLDDPGEIQWWVDNGDKTTLHVRLVVKGDGVAIQTIDAYAPYVGQSIAAELKNAGP